MNVVSANTIKLFVTRTIILFSAIFSGYATKGQGDPLLYKPGEDLNRKTSSNLFLKVKTNKNEALTGEGITAWYYLYVAVDLEGKLTKSPSFKGFASYDMEDGNSEAYKVEKINGVPFRVYQVKKVQLYGLRPGTQTLEPVEMEASIRYRRAPGDINDYLLGKEQNDTLFRYTLKSAPVSILIKKLPISPPGIFSGGVGDFDCSIHATQKQLASGKADTIQLQLQGSGNWHEIMMPEIKWPEGAEVFEPFESESLDPQKVPVPGSRSVFYPVVFHKKGNYKVGPVSFTYFNPYLKKYKTIQTDSILITVTEPTTVSDKPNSHQSGKFTAYFTRYAGYALPAAAIILLGLLVFRKKRA